jgi:alkylation response protein AidB-like acyl-CoA dehydrogenase
MDFSFSDEQNELRELARKILGDLATNDRLKDVEASSPSFDEELWRELGRSNLLGLAIDDEHGGSGFGYFELCLLLQEIGRAVAPVPVYPTLVLAALPIAAFGSDAQKRQWLPRVASGDVILSGALVELEAEHVADLSTRAIADGADWRVTGAKALVPAGQLAERILVPAATDDGRIGLFLVDPSATGVSLEPVTTCDRQPYALLTLDAVRVTAGDVVGDLAGGAESLAWLADRATIALCAIQLGVGERALEMTAEYGRERSQFDRPIGSFQAFHQRAADAFINMEAIRLTTWEASLMLASGASGEAVANAIAIAKYWAAEGGQWNAYACQHLHGGIGIDVDYPLHRYFIWSTQLEHSLGSASDQLARLGARIARSGIPPSA